MSIMSKLTFGLLAAACAGMLSAQEVKLSMESPADFTQSKRIVQAEDAFSVKGLGAFFSVKSLTIDPARKYQISGEFRMKSGKPVLLYFGFAPYDAKNRPILPKLVNGNSKCLTEVAEAAKKGDQVIKVKDASQWNTKSKYCHIAFGAKEDLSDLPNRDLLATVPPNVRQNGEVWEVLLAKPLVKDIAAGTPVRQHSDGAAWIYTAGLVKLTDQWVTRKGVITGIAPSGIPSNKFWKGTEQVKVLILCSVGAPDSEVQFRNIKIMEIK